MEYNLTVIVNTLQGEVGLEKVDLRKQFSFENYNAKTGAAINAYIDKYQKHYQDIYNKNVELREKKMEWMQANKRYDRPIIEVKNRNYNESLADLVKNVSTKERLIEYNGKLIQQVNPIFQNPTPGHLLDYRTAFFVPSKNFAGITFTTFGFNIMVIWIMTLFFYITLYFEALRKLIDSFGKVNFPSKK